MFLVFQYMCATARTWTKLCHFILFIFKTGLYFTVGTPMHSTELYYTILYCAVALFIIPNLGVGVVYFTQLYLPFYTLLLVY